MSEQTTLLSAEPLADEEMACPGCGQSRRELYQHGQMGCARCYQTFSPEVERALKEIHGESRHLGKNSE